MAPGLGEGRRKGGGSLDVVDSADMADAVVVAGRCVLFRAIVTHMSHCHRGACRRHYPVF